MMGYRTRQSVPLLVVTALLVMGVAEWTQAGDPPRIPLRKDSFFGLHFDIHAQANTQDLGGNTTEANITNLLNQAKPDFVQWDLKGAFGYASYPTRVGVPAPGIVRDALPIWRKVTRQHGVALYGYYCGLSDELMATQHPEWAQLDASGKRNPIGLSTFTPYTTAYMIPQLNEAENFYTLDGFWVDAQCLSAGLDYCPDAVAQWRNATGLMAAPTLKSDANWYAWKQFNRQQFLNHLNTWVNAVHLNDRKAQVGSNWTYSAYAPEPVLSKVDFLTGDFSYADGVDAPRLQARFLSGAGIPWDLMAWGFVHSGPTNYLVLPAQAVEQEAAAVIMQGGAFEIYHHPGLGSVIPDEIIQQAGEVGAFLHARKLVSFKSTSVPQVALLLSAETYFERCDTSFAYRGQNDELEGVLHGLLEAHYSVDVLSEAELQPRLAQFPLVVVPNSYRLTPQFLAGLLTYVQNGGNLLVIGAKCTRLFAPALGVTVNGPPVVLPGYVPTGLGLAAVDGYWQPVTALPGTSVIAERFPTTDFHGPGAQVAATLCSYGKGKIVGMYGPLAIDYHVHDGDAFLRQWLTDSVYRLFPNPAVTLEGSDKIDLSLRHMPDGKLCVHLLNRTPIAGNPPAADAIVPPVGPMTLAIKVPRKPQSVRLFPGNTPMRFTWENGMVHLTIPTLSIHAVVVIE